MNVGVVQGNELQALTNKIMERANGQNKTARVKKAPETQVETPQIPVFSTESYIPIETKQAKAGMEQKNLKLDENIQQKMNSQMAISAYGAVAPKNAKNLQFGELTQEKLGNVLETAKNPFGSEEDNLRNMFDPRI